MSSEPAQGASLSASPSSVRLVFSETVEIALASVKLVHGADTLTLAPLALDASDPRVVIAPLHELGQGAYRIVWSLAARDGHVIRGEIAFAVGTPASVSGPGSSPEGISTVLQDETASARAAIGGAIGWILTRWLGFISLFVLIGAVAFRFFVLRRVGEAEADSFMQIASTNAATLGLVSAIGVLLSALLKLVHESSDMPDIGLSSMMFGSSWGLALTAQILLAIIAAGAFRAAHGSNASAREVAWRVAFITAVALGFTPALGGHAIAGDSAYLAIPADVVHILAGSAWLGTLAVIVVVGIPAALKTPDMVRPGARVAKIINAFSPVALMCGGIVVATGLGSSVVRLPSVDALWKTPYGVTLLLKLFFVAMLFGAGAWNWRRMRPRLTGDDAIAPLRSSASFELILAAAVLGITAVLVALELP